MDILKDHIKVILLVETSVEAFEITNTSPVARCALSSGFD